MNCRKVAELLIDFLDGTLTEDDASLLQRHLCGCVPCAIYIHTYQETIRITHTLPDEPLPDEFASRLRRVLEEAGAGDPPAAM